MLTKPVALMRPVAFVVCVFNVGFMSPKALGALTLEEIVVTAQKRAESAQDVPISMNAISAEQLHLTGAGNLEGLSDSVTNVDIADSPGVTRVVIRGLGSGTGNAAFEQSVGMFVDGVYASRAALFQSPFLDLDRIEVLKGPQGVLFGKNSIAGAVSLVSNRPTVDLQSEISASYDFEYGGRELTALLSGALSDKVSGRVAIRGSEEKGYMSNELLNQDVPETDSAVVRGSLVWDINENTELWIKAEKSDLREVGTNWQVVADFTPGTLPSILKNNPNFEPINQSQVLARASFLQSFIAGEDFIYDDNSYINEREFLDQESENLTLELTHMIGDSELVYLFGYGAYDRDQFSDQDFTASNIVNNLNEEEYEQTSHELRFASAGGETLDYIVGLYYLDRRLTLNSDQDGFGAIAPLSFSTTAGYQENSESYAAFGQLTWNISDDLRASLGLRYSVEEKEASNSRFNRIYKSDLSLAEYDPVRFLTIRALLNRSDFEYSDRRTERNLDPAFNVQWDFNDNAMAYFSWVQASKAGGYNTNETSGDIKNFGFEPEEAESIEIGMKSSFFDGRARLNLALFSTSFDDLQVGAFDSSVNGFVVKNAAKAESKGLEIEAVYAITDQTTLGTTAAYLDAEYQDFFASCPSNRAQAAKLNCFRDPRNPLALIQNLEGVQLDNAPKVTSSLFMDYVAPITNDLSLGFRVDANFKDETSLDFSQDENLIIDEYWKYNARLSLAPSDKKWTVALSVFNITDEQQATFGGQEFLLPGVYWMNRSRGREVELSVTYRFAQ